MRIFLSIAALMSFAASSVGFGAAPEQGPVPTTFLDIPLYDAPFNFERGGYTFSSMRQSVALSTGFYENIHRALMGGPGNEDSWRFWALLGADVLSEWTPLGSSWMHKEWNRSVLSHDDISSYNGTYRFPLLANSIKVDNVSDTDLIRLKRDHPADQVRLSSAGFESRIAQNLLFERHHFFDDSRTLDQFAMWTNVLNNTVYLSICGSNASNLATSRMEVADGADVGRRDAVGLDCDAWVYDLFRPVEPYASRGTHPSGVGIKRYVSHSQLSAPESEFLRRQMFLSLLSFADPFLYGQEGWDGNLFGHKVRWNANLANTLTSFGYVIDARLFVREEQEKLLLTLHNGFGKNYFPGVSAEWVDHPVGDGFFVTTALTLWSQPRDQRMDATEARLLADLVTSFSYKWTEATSTYFGLEGKTRGWVLGEPYLDGNLSVWTGFKTSLF